MAKDETELDTFRTEAGWTAWALTLAASGSLSAFLTTLTDLPEKAGLSEGKTIVVAAIGGLAITVGIVLAFVTIDQSKVTGHAAGTAATLCALGGVAVANAVGIGAVSWDLVLQQMNATSGAPIMKAFAVLGACLITYGPVASIQAAIAGCFLGRWAARLVSTQNGS